MADSMKVKAAEATSEAGTIITNNLWLCQDENGDFDWDTYQEICDIASEWDE